MLNEEWEVSDSNDLGTWNREALRDKMDGSNERGEPVKRGATRRNIVQEKSYAFALSMVKAARSIQSERREWALSRQLIRSAEDISSTCQELVRLLTSITLSTRRKLESARTRHSAFHIPHSTLER